ncbi:hypothetical protein CLOSTASPAR_02048 [[Clostridium] asparagiforme DSM 15981]|uniref:Uncharacterized protein n=1 Tax=[Clostridium] asparagiforme DSM 15981 TaxID=518636 RepID=C0CYH2_9FIRM|nr:hypothetical protein CLOSTASPAR_02048 [[Clostridium] asparagiforme DSM 15981]
MVRTAACEAPRKGREWEQCGIWVFCFSQITSSQNPYFLHMVLYMNIHGIPLCPLAQVIW